VTASPDLPDPSLVQPVQYGEQQIQLGSELVVQAHLRGSRFGCYRLDTDAMNTTVIEQAFGRVEQSLANAGRSFLHSALYRSLPWTPTHAQSGIPLLSL
jgi:hypothetical protein